MDEKTKKNRRLMPHTAAMIDWLRSEFPDIKVLYAKEGDYVMGKDLDRSKLVTPCIQIGIPPKERKKK
jgi:hypothetical protein